MIMKAKEEERDENGEDANEVSVVVVVVDEC